MIKLDELCSLALDKLRADEYFEGFGLTCAFEPLERPTVPAKPAVVCGIAQVSAQTSALEGECAAGSVSLFADIYIPFDLRGFDIRQAAVRALKCLAARPAVRFEMGQVRADNAAECFVMRVTVAFSGEISLLPAD